MGLFGSYGADTPEKMKTLKEMIRYGYKYNIRPVEGYPLEHIQAILRPDEYALCCCFAGRCVGEARGATSYVFSESRILFGRGGIGGSPGEELFFKTIDYNDIYKIVRESKFIIIKHVFGIEMFFLDEKDIDIVWSELEKKVLPLIQEKGIRGEYPSYCCSPADEIRKFKELLDDGIITEEEFEQKKKKLLDL